MPTRRWPTSLVCHPKPSLSPIVQQGEGASLGGKGRLGSYLAAKNAAEHRRARVGNGGDDGGSGFGGGGGSTVGDLSDVLSKCVLVILELNDCLR